MTEIRPIPAVNAAIFNKTGEVLLTRRSQSVRAPGMWVLPGGHVEIGESWMAAVVREVQEEVGILIQNPELMGVYSDPQLTVTKEVLPEGYHGHFVVAQFYASSFQGEVVPNSEVDLWGWYSLDNLPEPLLKSHPIRIKDAFGFQGEVFVR